MVSSDVQPDWANRKVYSQEFYQEENPKEIYVIAE